MRLGMLFLSRKDLHSNNEVEINKSDYSHAAPFKIYFKPAFKSPPI